MLLAYSWANKSSVFLRISFCECNQQVPATHRILVQPVLLHKTGAHRYEVWLAPLPCPANPDPDSTRGRRRLGEKEEAKAEEETGWKNIATHAAPCVVDDFAFAPALSLLNSLPP